MMNGKRFAAGGGMKICKYCGRAVSGSERFGPLPECST